MYHSFYKHEQILWANRMNITAYIYIQCTMYCSTSRTNGISNSLIYTFEEEMLMVENMIYWKRLLIADKWSDEKRADRKNDWCKYTISYDIFAVEIFCIEIFWYSCEISGLNNLHKLFLLKKFQFFFFLPFFRSVSWEVKS